MYIDDDRATFEGIRGSTLGFRPAGGGRPALRARSAPRTGAPARDEGPRRRHARNAPRGRSAETLGVHGALIRALRGRVGASWRLLASESWPWGSATFVGERHRFVAEADSALLAGIEAWEFALQAHIVADIAIVARDGGRVTIEALTVAAA